jgi:bifunctional DNA-binding transcriptional regulator/antitoxin component of YhaV-PrlF toxin-antitoxin module
MEISILESNSKKNSKNYPSYRINLPKEIVKEFNLKKGQKLIFKKNLIKKSFTLKIKPQDIISFQERINLLKRIRKN